MSNFEKLDQRRCRFYNYKTIISRSEDEQIVFSRYIRRAQKSVSALKEEKTLFTREVMIAYRLGFGPSRMRRCPLCAGGVAILLLS